MSLPPPGTVADLHGRSLDQVRLTGIRATGYHGVLDHERASGQTFVVDVVVHLDTRRAAAGDDLSLTLSYATLAEQIVEVIEGPAVQLVETLAEQIASVVMDHAIVGAVDVFVHKPQAPVPVAFDDVVIAVHRDRTKLPAARFDAQAAPAPSVPSLPSLRGVQGAAAGEAVAPGTGVQPDAAALPASGALPEVALLDAALAAAPLEATLAAAPPEATLSAGLPEAAPLFAVPSGTAPWVAPPSGGMWPDDALDATIVMPRADLDGAGSDEPLAAEPRAAAPFAAEPFAESPATGLPAAEPFAAEAEPASDHGEPAAEETFANQGWAQHLDPGSDEVPSAARELGVDAGPGPDEDVRSDEARGSDEAWRWDETARSDETARPEGALRSERVVEGDAEDALGVTDTPAGGAAVGLGPDEGSDSVAILADPDSRAGSALDDGAAVPDVIPFPDDEPVVLLGALEPWQVPDVEPAHPFPATTPAAEPADQDEAALAHPFAPVTAPAPAAEAPDEPAPAHPFAPVSAPPPEPAVQDEAALVHPFAPVTAPAPAAEAPDEAALAHPFAPVTAPAPAAEAPDEPAPAHPFAPVSAPPPEPAVQDEAAPLHPFAPVAPAAAEPSVRDDASRDSDRMDEIPAEAVRAILALGANLGDARETLRQAVRELESSGVIDIEAVAPLARTAAVGGPDQPDFLNTVIMVRTLLSARELLHLCQHIEEVHGRVRTERWGPRTLDIDIITYGQVTGVTDDLELPHPRAHERAFVLQPWDQIEPGAVLPGLGGGPVDALAATAPDIQGVRWLALDWLDERSGEGSVVEDVAPSRVQPSAPTAEAGPHQ